MTSVRPARFALALAVLVSLSIPGAGDAEPDSWSVSSPSEALTLTVRLTGDGTPEYRVALAAAGRPRTVVGWSALGVTRSWVDQTAGSSMVVVDLSRGLRLVDAAESRIEDEYTLLVGKRRHNRAVANQLSLTFRNEADARLRLDLRAYDEGVAFRYVLPGQSSLHHWLASERTEFNLGTTGTHWGQPYDFSTTYTPAYETPWVNGVPLGTATDPKLGTGWGFPSLFDVDGTWVLIHEAGLDETHQGSHLEPKAPDGVYRVAFPREDSAMGFGRAFPTNPLPWTLPWRFILASEDLGDIAESNMVFHLAEPSRIADTSWIRPGVASWSWLSDHDSSRNLDSLKPFIDFAAEMGWPYSLIDANWNLIGDDSMEQLVAHADEKGVGLLFWYNSGGSNNFVTEEPRNRMHERKRRREEFARLQKLGVKGVKVDFFQSDKQFMIQRYLRILEDAADYQIMVDFHGCTIPRGWERTWPNLMSMEAVRGAETYTFASTPDYGKLAPWQNTILPVTRNVIGSMDFTPVVYSPQMITRRTTNGHETALAVLFESGLQHIGEGVATLRTLPANYLAFFRDLENVWDETRFVTGYPGRDMVFARRHGQKWYVAGINGEDEGKTLSLDLSFLGRPAIEGLLLYDGEEADGFASKRVRYDGDAPVEMTLRPRGGFTLILD
jgi:alpha-glucosidase